MTDVKATFEFYEKNLTGTFDGKPRIYVLHGKSKEEIVESKDILWQAIEIEGFDNSEVMVAVQFEEDGEYLDREEFIMTANIVRTDKPSGFIEWGAKRPHIFAVDRNASTIKVESN